MLRGLLVRQKEQKERLSGGTLDLTLLDHQTAVEKEENFQSSISFMRRYIGYSQTYIAGCLAPPLTSCEVTTSLLVKWLRSYMPFLYLGF